MARLFQEEKDKGGDGKKSAATSLNTGAKRSCGSLVFILVQLGAGKETIEIGENNRQKDIDKEASKRTREKKK